MNVTIADFTPLSLDCILSAGILLIFLLDLFVEAPAAKKGLGWLTAAILAGTLAASFRLQTDGTAFGVYEGGAWPLFFKRVFLVIGLLASLGSIEHLSKHQPHRQGEYYLLMLFSLLGMTLLPGARDLIFLLVSFELMSVPLFVLAAYAKSDSKTGPGRFAPEAGLKLYLVGVASTALTLFGLSLIFGSAGTTRIADLANHPSPLLSTGMILVLAGMGFKIGAVPFHMWVPDTYQGASTPFVAFLSVAPKVAGFSALLTLFYLGFGLQLVTWFAVAATICVVTMVAGNLLAINQSNVKRLLAYSGVGHIGYMLLAFVTASPEGATMLLFYTAAYAFTNIGAFLVIEALSADGGDDGIESFNGLAQRTPWLALAMLLFLLSLGGIPFVLGFWAKLYVFVAAWQQGLYGLVVAGAVLAVVALFYYMRVARAMYMNPPVKADRVTVSASLALPIVLCAVGVVGFGLAPSLILDQARGAARPFFANLEQRAPVAAVIPARSR